MLYFVKKLFISTFISFGVEYIPEEVKDFIGNKNIKTNIFRVQEDNSIMCGYFCIGFIDFMLAGKKLTHYTNLFSPLDLKMTVKFCLILKMTECNSIKNNSFERIDKTFLSEQTKFRLDEIREIENYFIKEINQRKPCSQKLNKYVTAFDYINKILIVLSATTEEYQLFHLQVLLEHQLE